MHSLASNGGKVFLVLGCFISLWNAFLVLNVYDAKDGTATLQHIIDAPFRSDFNESDKNVGRLFSPGNISDTATSAACLLIMDDNHFLIEWVAYHYHVLNLRRLIVAVDPRSRTSPGQILNRWSDFMNITIWWNDTDYISNLEELKLAEDRVRIVSENAKVTPKSELIRHRARQRLFYSHCLLEHKRSNSGWTVFVDTDEFLSINYEALHKLRPQYDQSIEPSMAEPGSVLKLLQYEQQYYSVFRTMNNLTSSPCVQIPRIRYGTVESNIEMDPDLEKGRLPIHFNASHFATLRWKVHANSNNYGMNRISKTMIDLGRIDEQYLYDRHPIVESIHKPIPGPFCTQRKLHIRSTEQIFLIHHYLGTYEQYTFRNDARTGNERSLKVRALDKSFAQCECLY
jgi:Glycosyltransferase family 92